ncbi:hypothetical protein EPR50_G00022870 [Perca flavescens]|uniref:Uncharacterized protein n=1 Tax=Perca flavescens TaxID=8167 RepID=A0A484DGT5_PERFV|nr:hypothetical protein EPR50_G00022870 [Perca flavescens]
MPLGSSTPPISRLTNAAYRPCPFLSVARSVDFVVEDWDTDNGKLSLRPAMLTLHSLLLGIHVKRFLCPL